MIIHKKIVYITALYFAISLCSCSASNPISFLKSYPSIDNTKDDRLQRKLEQVVESDPKLKFLAQNKRLAFGMLDIRKAKAPKFAAVNPFQMIYAASLPKVATLYGLLKRVEEGTLRLTPQIEKLAIDMMRVSSNTASTDLYHIVGPDYLSRLLLAPPHRIYDFKKGGGLWVGKEYAKGIAWLRDPLLNISHAANVYSVIKLYYLLETGQLLNRKMTLQMKRFMSGTALNHKFAKALSYDGKTVRLYRKSGSWWVYHSDSAIIYHRRKKYIAVVLVHSDAGEEIIEYLILKMDQMADGGWF